MLTISSNITSLIIRSKNMGMANPSTFVGGGTNADIQLCDNTQVECKVYTYTEKQGWIESNKQQQFDDDAEALKNRLVHNKVKEHDIPQHLRHQMSKLTKPKIGRNKSKRKKNRGK